MKKVEEIKDFIVREISSIDRKRQYSGRMIKITLKEIIRKMELAGLVKESRLTKKSVEVVKEEN